MSTFSPHRAALIADGVYAVRRDSSRLDTRAGRARINLPADFEIASGSSFTGQTGLVIKAESAMGYIASGTGSRKGEAIIATRGTATGWDALTDAHVGYRPGPGGRLVHTGFDQAFESFQASIKSYLRKNNVSHVHCIGHSLGGALATLGADLISEGKMAGVSLYTFGGPRVGVESFARHLTSKIGPDNIRQAHHDSDPVAMVPLFPYYHPPHPGQRFRWGFGGALVSPKAHSMVNYISTAENKDWVHSAPPVVSVGAEVEAWLGSADAGVVAFSRASLAMIKRAIIWVLKKAGMAVGGVTFFGLQQAGTALDMMAFALESGALAAMEVAEWVGSLVRKVLRWVGMAVSAAQEMTRQFIRWALGMLYKGIAMMVRGALAVG